MSALSWPRSRKRIRFIPQMETAECGAASLAMILAHHGHHAPLAEVRAACGVSRDGADALGILRAGREYGLEAEAVKVEAEDLEDLPLPAILHWDFSHFLVLERVERRSAIVVDPASGRLRLSRGEIHHRFTGVALVFAPEAPFTRRAEVKASLSRYRRLFRQALPSLGQILIASLMLQVIGLALPVASQILLDRILIPKQQAWLWGLAFGLTAAVIGRTLIDLVRNWVIQGVQTAMDLSLMGGFMDHLLHLPLGFFLQRRPGDLMQRVQSNTVLRNLFTSRSISALLDGFLLAGFALLMLAYSPLLGAIVLLLGFLRLGIQFYLKDRNQQFMSSELAASGREGAALVEALTSIETTKASRAEDRMLNRWADRMAERVNSSVSRQRIGIASSGLMIFLQGVTQAAVYWVGGRETLSGQMSVGMFASFITLQGLFMGPLESLAGAVDQLQYVGNHLRRLDDVLETGREPSGSLRPARLAGLIELKSVSFAYSTSGPEVLSGVDLRIEPGEMVAIVGPSGAGKSTLARLMLGLHLPVQGAVRFDGIDIQSLELTSVRRQMGVVLQETFLFDDSIRANLSLNAPDLPMDRLVEAASLACIHEFIESLPRGYATRVGENGGLLSGGQRQRLALARALAHDPTILLMDEATSALDLAIEAQIQSNLAALGCTRIVIAHRLATVKRADRIIVLEHGRIVQEGDYRSLEASAGLFNRLVQAMEQAHG